MYISILIYQVLTAKVVIIFKMSGHIFQRISLHNITYSKDWGFFNQ